MVQPAPQSLANLQWMYITCASHPKPDPSSHTLYAYSYNCILTTYLLFSLPVLIRPFALYCSIIPTTQMPPHPSSHAPFPSRISGTAVVLENPAWHAQRQAWWTTITPSAGHLNSWFHLPVPSPATSETPMRAVRAAVRFQTGSGAVVRQYLVADGEIVRYNGENLSLTQPRMGVCVREVPGHPTVANAFVITLQVEFSGLTPENYIRLSWAEVVFERAGEEDG
ncbi:hypothetical protein V8F06_006075 [Rhypophila decipiens]